jgi:hypothetical protein
VKLGPLEMKIDEASVSTATEIPGEGERWFKTTSIKDIEFISYLKTEFRSIIWQKDFPRNYLEDKCQKLLKVIQVYISVKGSMAGSCHTILGLSIISQKKTL